MSEIKDKARERVNELQLELRQIVNAHARNESMSLTERKENIDLAVDHFIDQILSIPELAIVDREAHREFYDEGHQVQVAIPEGWVKEVK